MTQYSHTHSSNTPYSLAHPPHHTQSLTHSLSLIHITLTQSLSHHHPSLTFPPHHTPPCTYTLYLTSLLTHSLIHNTILTCPLTHPPDYSYHSVTHSLTHSLVHPLVHSPCLTHPARTVAHHHSDISEHSRLILHKGWVQWVSGRSGGCGVQLSGSMAQVAPQQPPLYLCWSGRFLSGPHSPRTLAAQGHYVDRPAQRMTTVTDWVLHWITCGHVKIGSHVFYTEHQLGLL